MAFASKIKKRRHRIVMADATWRMSFVSLEAVLGREALGEQGELWLDVGKRQRRPPGKNIRRSVFLTFCRVDFLRLPRCVFSQEECALTHSVDWWMV